MKRHVALEDSKQAIMDTIQRVYSDTTQGVLDRTAATEVIKTLERLGWMDPFTIRALVAAAGGKIVLTDKHLTDPPEELLTYESNNPPGHVLKTRRTVRSSLL